MTHIDADDVSRLRAAIGRLSRQLNASVADIGYSPSQLSVLGTVARRGPIGIGELAELEGINPTMLSRIVGKLSDADLDRTDRAPGRRAGCRRPDHNRRSQAARASARAAQQGHRRPTREHARPASRAAARRTPGTRSAGRPMSETFTARRIALSKADLRRARHPQLPPLLHRPGDLTVRHLDAVGGAVVADLQAHRIRDGRRLGRGAADPAGPGARAVRRGGGRSDRQAQADDGAAVDDGRPCARSRTAGRHQPRSRVGSVRPRIPAGLEQLLRESGPAVVRARDGRREGPAQRGQPELHHGERGACSRRGDCGHRHRRRRHRILLPAERGQLRRCRVLARFDGRQRAAPDAAHRTARKASFAKGFGIRRRPSRSASRSS